MVIIVFMMFMRVEDCSQVILFLYIYVMHQMRNARGGSHTFHFGVTSTMMHTGTNRKAQQSCGSGTDREWDITPRSR